MRSRFVQIGFGIALTLICISSPVKGQVDPIETYLSSAEQKATNVVNNAGTKGQGVAMEAGQAALNAISAFRAAYGDSLRLTEGMLEGEQAKFFTRIKATIDRLDEWMKDATVNLQDVAGPVAEAIKNLPFSKDIPRVTKVSPLYVVEGSGEELVFRGVGLSNGDPVLVTPSGILRPRTETDSEVRFDLPPLSAMESKKPGAYSVTLRVFERKSKLFVFTSYLPHTYPVTVAIYPQVLGEAKITPRRKVTSIESRQQTTPEYRCDSPRGEGSNGVSASVVPSPGWSIEVSSIRYNRAWSDHGSFTMNSTSPAGFTASLSCSGWGRVVVAGVVIDQGSIGVEKGHFTFTESRAVESLQNGTQLTATLRWGNALTFSDLPNDTETVIVEYSPFTGEQLSLVGESRDRFLIISFAQATRVATLTTKGVEEVLRQ